MITLFTGMPGSGKTYRMVYDLLRLPTNIYYIFHNIDGLKEELFEAGEYIQSWTDIPDFLTREKQQELSESIARDHDRKMLVIIDEAWEFLGRKSKYEPEALAWLKMHRHMGQQVWICTQSYKDLSQGVYDVCPIEIRGKRGIAGSAFRYQHNVKGETFRTDRRPKDKATFLAYKSFQGATGEKIKGTKMGYFGLAAALVGVVVAIYAFGPGLKKVFRGPKEAQATPITSAKKNTESAPAPKMIKPSGPPPVVEPLKEYSFAGCAGENWWVQEVNGGRLIKGNYLQPEYKVIGCERGLVVLHSGKTGLVRLGKKGIINIPMTPSENSPPSAGSSEGGIK